MQARGNANFIQECRNAERQRIGMLNLRSCEEMTQLWRVLTGEVEGGNCGRDTSLTLNWLPASRLVHHARMTEGGCSCAVRSWPGLSDPSIHKQCPCHELLPHPHTYTRNVKQVRGSTGEREKKCCTGTRERGTRRKTQRSTGTRAHLCYLGFIYKLKTYLLDSCYYCKTQLCSLSCGSNCNSYVYFIAQCIKGWEINHEQVVNDNLSQE